MRERLKWILSSSQLVLALLLEYWGSIQTLKHTTGGVTYDYISPPELVLHTINLPAAALVCAGTRNGTFQIGVEHSVPIFIGYLILIFALWYVIGWRLSYRPSVNSSSLLVKSLGVAGVVFGLFLIIVGALMLEGPMALLLIFAAFAWGVGMVVGFGLLLRSRGLTQSGVSET